MAPKPKGRPKKKPTPTPTPAQTPAPMPNISVLPLPHEVALSKHINIQYDKQVQEAAPRNQKWFVYILGINNPVYKIYVGCTGNLEIRMHKHRTGNGGSTGKQQSTGLNLPVWLIAAVELPMKDAMEAYEGYLHVRQFGTSLPDDWVKAKTVAFDVAKWTARSKLDNTLATVDSIKWPLPDAVKQGQT